MKHLRKVNTHYFQSPQKLPQNRRLSKLQLRRDRHYYKTLGKQNVSERKDVSLEDFISPQEEKENQLDNLPGFGADHLPAIEGSNFIYDFSGKNGRLLWWILFLDMFWRVSASFNRTTSTPSKRDSHSIDSQKNPKVKTNPRSKEMNQSLVKAAMTPSNSQGMMQSVSPSTSQTSCSSSLNPLSDRILFTNWRDVFKKAFFMNCSDAEFTKLMSEYAKLNNAGVKDAPLVYIEKFLDKIGDALVDLRDMGLCKIRSLPVESFEERLAAVRTLLTDKMNEVLIKLSLSHAVEAIKKRSSFINWVLPDDSPYKTRDLPIVTFEKQTNYNNSLVGDLAPNSAITTRNYVQLPWEIFQGDYNTFRLNFALTEELLEETYQPSPNSPPYIELWRNGNGEETPLFRLDLPLEDRNDFREKAALCNQNYYLGCIMKMHLFQGQSYNDITARPCLFQPNALMERTFARLSEVANNEAFIEHIARQWIDGSSTLFKKLTIEAERIGYKNCSNIFARAASLMKAKEKKKLKLETLPRFEKPVSQPPWWLLAPIGIGIVYVLYRRCRGGVNRGQLGPNQPNSSSSSSSSSESKQAQTTTSSLSLAPSAQIVVRKNDPDKKYWVSLQEQVDEALMSVFNVSLRMGPFRIEISLNGFGEVSILDSIAKNLTELADFKEGAVERTAHMVTITELPQCSDHLLPLAASAALKKLAEPVKKAADEEKERHEKEQKAAAEKREKERQEKEKGREKREQERSEKEEKEREEETRQKRQKEEEEKAARQKIRLAEETFLKKVEQNRGQFKLQWQDCRNQFPNAEYSNIFVTIDEDESESGRKDGKSCVITFRINPRYKAQDNRFILQRLASISSALRNFSSSGGRGNYTFVETPNQHCSLKFSEPIIFGKNTKNKILTALQQTVYQEPQIKADEKESQKGGVLGIEKKKLAQTVEGENTPPETGKKIIRVIIRDAPSDQAALQQVTEAEKKVSKEEEKKVSKEKARAKQTSASHLAEKQADDESLEDEELVPQPLFGGRMPAFTIQEFVYLARNYAILDVLTSYDIKEDSKDVGEETAKKIYKAGVIQIIFNIITIFYRHCGVSHPELSECRNIIRHRGWMIEGDYKVWKEYARQILKDNSCIDLQYVRPDRDSVVFGINIDAIQKKIDSESIRKILLASGSGLNVEDFRQHRVQLTAIEKWLPREFMTEIKKVAVSHPSTTADSFKITSKMKKMDVTQRLVLLKSWVEDFDSFAKPVFESNKFTVKNGVVEKQSCQTVLQVNALRIYALENIVLYCAKEFCDAALNSLPRSADAQKLKKEIPLLVVISNIIAHGGTQQQLPANIENGFNRMGITTTEMRKPLSNEGLVQCMYKVSCITSKLRAILFPQVNNTLATPNIASTLGRSLSNVFYPIPEGTHSAPSSSTVSSITSAPSVRS